MVCVLVVTKCRFLQDGSAIAEGIYNQQLPGEKVETRINFLRFNESIRTYKRICSTINPGKLDTRLSSSNKTSFKVIYPVCFVI